MKNFLESFSTNEIRETISMEDALEIMAIALHPRHFCSFRSLTLDWKSPHWSEEYWELFRGNLLPTRQCRKTRQFLTADVFADAKDDVAHEPLVSVKYDAQTGQFHVVRAIVCHVWEGSSNEQNAGTMIEMCEKVRFVRELVGTVDLAHFRQISGVLDELRLLLTQAVVGTSRLPLTSLETPLPQFALGQLGYFFDDRVKHTTLQNAKPHDSWRTFLAGLQIQHLTDSENAKAFELVCRTITEAEVGEFADLLKTKWKATHFGAAKILALFRRMFNEVSLSPYTGFVDRVLSVLRQILRIELLSVEQHIDFLSFVLRQLGRHLTAYDLVTFHHRGANYPDALFLDALLGEYIGLIAQYPALFERASSSDADSEKKHRVRRRALRQGCLIRRHYENLAVPDLPTSPGENTRVLPAPYGRVPEEQITQIQHRRRQLFKEAPTAGLLNATATTIIQQSIEDVRHPDEWRELGTAIFIDRPLGAGKQPSEPDRTILFSYEAYSQSLAQQRVSELRKLAGELGQCNDIHESVCNEEFVGLPAQQFAAARPAATTLADVQRVAEDFVLMRTFTRGVREFLDCFDFTPLWNHLGCAPMTISELTLVVPIVLDDAAGLGIFDANYRLCCEMKIVLDQGYFVKRGIELPIEGLRVLRIWNAKREQLEHVNFVVKTR